MAREGSNLKSNVRRLDERDVPAAYQLAFEAGWIAIIGSELKRFVEQEEA